MIQILMTALSIIHHLPMYIMTIKQNMWKAIIVKMVLMYIVTIVGQEISISGR